MRYSAAAAVFGLAALSAAQVPNFNPIYSPDSGEEVIAGSTYTIVWDATPAEYIDETVSLSLIGGEEQNLQVPLFDIASGIANSDEKYEWEVPADEFGKKFYGLVIKLESNETMFQFSNPFKLVDGGLGGEGDDDERTTTISGSDSVTKTVSLSEATTSSEPIEEFTTSSSILNETTSTTVSTSFSVPTTTTQDTQTPPTSSPSVIPTDTPEDAANSLGGASFVLMGVAALAAIAL